MYGEITALCHAEGYCWATNAYFASLYSVDVSTIKRWLSSLESGKFIRNEITKEGIHFQRKIWISQEIQKMFAKAQKRATPSSKMSYTQLKNEPHINTCIITKKKKEISPKPPLNEGQSEPPETEDQEKPSADASALVDIFLNNLKKRNPDFLPKDQKKWVIEMERMLRLDNRTFEDVKKMIDWVSQDMFWRDVVLSPKKLREKFQDLKIKMSGNSEKELIRKNRDWAIKTKNKYPEQMRGLSFDDKYAMNREMSKEIPFNLPHETFKDALINMFGGSRA